MGEQRISRDQLPADGVRIGGDDDCEHATYVRIGSDGGANIYFNCTECSQVVLKYSAVAEEQTVESGSEPIDSDLYPETKSKPSHDPLVKGLSFNFGNSKEGSTKDGHSRKPKRDGSGTSEGTGVFEQFKSAIERLLRREKR